MYWNHAPRACIGIELLCTYPKIRPAELRQVKEKHIDLKNLTITIPSPKEQDEPKVVNILPVHGKLIRSLPRGFPKMYFLRYDYPVKGRRVGDRFGRDYLYHVWRRACKALGVEGVPLYPGTKHTTISDWARRYPEARVQQAAGVLSNAIKRYMVLGKEDCVSLYKEARPCGSDKILTMNFEDQKDVLEKKQ
jgi:integrase